MHLAGVASFSAFSLATSFLLAALVTWVSVPLTIRLANRLGWVDRPGGRRIHLGVVPRAGGLAVALGFLAGSLAYATFADPAVLAEAHRRMDVVVFLACAGAVFLIGLADDVLGLRPSTRLLVEGVAAVGLTQVGFLIESIATPVGALSLGHLAYPVTVLWIVGVTNAYNLIDGLDALLPTIALIGLLGCAAVGLRGDMVGTPAVALLLAAALVGFLPWNWHPARTFMGDSGSLLIGFVLAAWTLKVAQDPDGALSFQVPVMLCALPLAEAALTLARRYVSHQPFFSGDRSHIHHVLLQKGLPVSRAVISLGAVAALFASAAYLSQSWRADDVLLLALLLLAIGVCGLRYLGYVELRVLVDQLTQVFRRRRRALPALLAVARAGDLLRDVSSVQALEERLREATSVGEFDYVALEFESELAVQLGLEDRAEVHNEHARTYLRGSSGAALWLFSTPSSVDGMQTTASFGLPLTAGDRSLGRLVCHRSQDRGAPVPPDQVLQRYMSTPVERALERLRTASAAGESANGRADP